MSNIICGSHSTLLMDKLRHKGMAMLVRPERAAVFAQRWLDGTASQGEFDPYVVSVLEMKKKAAEFCGGHAQGVICGPCRAARVLQRADLPEMWIDNVTDLMYMVCKTNGLIRGALNG